MYVFYWKINAFLRKTGKVDDSGVMVPAVAE